VPFLKTAEQIDKLKADGLLLYGQVPLLQIDGMNLVQRMAICRYVARKHHLMGDNDKDAARIDVRVEGMQDLYSPIMGRHFMPEEAYMAGVKKAADRYLPIFEKELHGDYFVGNKISLADVAMFEATRGLTEAIPDGLAATPKLKAHMERIKNLPNMHKFLTGPQQNPPNNPALVKEILVALRWA